MFKRTLITVLGVIVLLAGLGFVLATAAHASVKPMVGVSTQFNAPMCGTNDWERIKTPATEFAVNDSVGTCVDSEKYHPDFAVASVTNRTWQYPDITSGYVPTGESTCASAKDTCFDYPVQVKDDGTPEASVGTWISGGYQGNESFDIWFSPDKNRHSSDDRNGDTELMIWTAYPGIHDKLKDYVTIDGMRFGVMTWEAGHNGTQWRYVAYLWLGANDTSKGHQVNVSGLWLNPFFRNAESHDWLISSNEWLWAIDFGFEMVQNGLHNNVHDYSLLHVN